MSYTPIETYEPMCCGSPMLWVESHDDYQCRNCRCFKHCYG